MKVAYFVNDLRRDEIEASGKRRVCDEVVLLLDVLKRCRKEKKPNDFFIEMKFSLS